MLYKFYQITNNSNGKSYIGLTKRQIETRYAEHVKNALRGHDLQNDYFMPLMNAIRKYGKDSFDIKLLDEKEFVSFSEAEIYEGVLIETHKTLLNENGYNLNHRTINGRTYANLIQEKIERNNLGENNPFFGHTHSEETKQRLSHKAKERFAIPENNPRYGYRFTDEDKEKWRNAKQKFGKPFYAEGTLYHTLGEAARKFNLTKQAIQHRIKSSNYKDWYYE